MRCLARDVVKNNRQTVNLAMRGWPSQENADNLVSGSACRVDKPDRPLVLTMTPPVRIVDRSPFAASNLTRKQATTRFPCPGQRATVLQTRETNVGVNP
jgi:hypothetical protein